MALSELDMMNLWAKQLTGYKSQWDRLFGFGYAIEAEVRKQDDALIRQMLEAMEGVKALNMGGELALWTAEFDRLLSATTAAHARLGEKT